MEEELFSLFHEDISDAMRAGERKVIPRVFGEKSFDLAMLDQSRDQYEERKKKGSFSSKSKDLKRSQEGERIPFAQYLTKQSWGHHQEKLRPDGRE